MDLGTILAILGIVSTIMGVVAWALRLEGRINTAEKLTETKDELYMQKHNDLKELINSKFDTADNRLERIERALNGALHRP